MKKIIIFAILIFMALPLLAQEEVQPEEPAEVKDEVVLTLSSGEQALEIPETYEELKEYYIEIAELYAEEEVAHTKTLARVDEVLALLEEQKAVSADLKKLLDECINYTPPLLFWQNGIVLGGGAGLDWTNSTDPIYPTVQVGYRALILEKYSFDILGTWPLGLKMNFGFIF